MFTHNCTHTHTPAQSPDHRYCELHESLSTVQCAVGWSYTHARTDPCLFISLLCLFHIQEGKKGQHTEGDAIYRTLKGKLISNATSSFSSNSIISNEFFWDRYPRFSPSSFPFLSTHVPSSSSELLWSQEQLHTTGWWLPWRKSETKRMIRAKSKSLITEDISIVTL